jgi:hypothetical protein
MVDCSPTTARAKPWARKFIATHLDRVSPTRKTLPLSPRAADRGGRRDSVAGAARVHFGSERLVTPREGRLLAQPLRYPPSGQAQPVRRRLEGEELGAVDAGETIRNLGESVATQAQAARRPLPSQGRRGRACRSPWIRASASPTICVGSASAPDLTGGAGLALGLHHTDIAACGLVARFRERRAESK